MRMAQTTAKVPSPTHTACFPGPSGQGCERRARPITADTNEATTAGPTRPTTARRATDGIKLPKGKRGTYSQKARRRSKVTSGSATAAPYQREARLRRGRPVDSDAK